MSKVIILTGPIQSGKTTSLIKHYSKTDGVGGFICPDVNGKRMMYFPAENRLMEFQIPITNSSINVGKYSFDELVFNKAFDLIRTAAQSNYDYFIIDEVGPLELKQQGYYDALVALFENAKYKTNLTIILVVREHLVNDVITKFNFSDVRFTSKEDLANDAYIRTDINGLILSGGESSRMKSDKYLLKYDGLEQYKRLQQIFNEMGLPVFLSCNKNQFSNEEVSIDKITDDLNYKDAGPLTGILSAFNQLQSDLLIVGCDYPLLKIEHLQMLRQFSEYGFDEIAFVKNERVDVVEPLICFLSKQSLQKLKLFYINGGRSLNKYLQQVNSLKIQLNDDSFLRSFDTPDDYHSYFNN